MIDDTKPADEISITVIATGFPDPDYGEPFNSRENSVNAINRRDISKRIGSSLGVSSSNPLLSFWRRWMWGPVVGGAGSVRRAASPRYYNSYKISAGADRSRNDVSSSGGSEGVSVDGIEPSAVKGDNANSDTPKGKQGGRL